MELFGIVRLCLCDFYLNKMGRWGDEKEEGGYTLNNLITSLLLFINNPEVRDTDYQIASCLLEHCYEIKNMTIQELAEKSYVSVSTINRFLKMYGFSRYSIFKSVFYQHVLSRYNQMRGRLSEWMPGQVECMLHTVLSEAAYRRVTDSVRQYGKAEILSQRI